MEHSFIDHSIASTSRLTSAGSIGEGLGSSVSGEDGIDTT
jgi:hypothetical protein